MCDSGIHSHPHKNSHTRLCSMGTVLWKNGKQGAQHMCMIFMKNKISKSPKSKSKALVAQLRIFLNRWLKPFKQMTCSKSSIKPSLLFRERKLISPPPLP